MNLIPDLAPYFERYITLERKHPTATYDYKARGFFALPVIEITMHKPKCTPDSWLYLATSADAKLSSLTPEDKLYVGSQTGDRMFRGDGLAGRNFHHAQMRAGNDDDNPISFLGTGRKATIHRISARSIGRAVAEVAGLRRFHPLLTQPSKHVGYWFEQYVLYSEGDSWRWNCAPVDGPAKAVCRML